MEGYRKLADAIILQAVKDYRIALKALKSHPDSKAAAARIKDVEEFFYSDWYRMMTKIDPDYLINRLRKEAEG